MGAMSSLMFLGDVDLRQAEDGGYIISIDPIENYASRSWEGDTPEDAIDAAMKKEGK